MRARCARAAPQRNAPVRPWRARCGLAAPPRRRNALRSVPATVRARCALAAPFELRERIVVNPAVDSGDTEGAPRACSPLE
eukprot:9112823-Alexandrium_andersonii.AAC.1